MKKEDSILSLKVAATFLGTIIGAGFASGQEILRFFTIYRFDGFLGIIIASILFVVFGTIIFNISHKIKRKSYNDFLNYVCGKKAGLIVDILLTVFLFGTLNVMLSATGALFYEYFGLPYYFGIILTVIPAFIIVVKGIKSILEVNFIIAPIMVITVIIISSLCLYYHADSDLIRNLHYEDDNTYKWLMSSLLYVSYNIILATPILVPLGREIKNKKVLTRGIAIGAVVMGILILILNTVILNHIEQDSLYQIPMLYIIEPFSKFIKYAFIVILWLEIFTTIISNLFGLCSRIQAAVKMDFKLIVSIICVMSLFISRLDFKTLLSILYPTFGFITLLFILFLIIKQIYLKLRVMGKSITGSVKNNSAN